MDKIIERVLAHWYAPDHELYGDPLPALLGLTGESGELCDLWKKKLYKPGYVFDRDAFLDELGDCLFYTAVLCHYKNVSVEQVDECTYLICADMMKSIAILNDAASNMLLMQLEYDKTLSINVHKCVAAISAILHFDDNGVTLEELSLDNYAKLNKRATNGTGYNRGNEKDGFVICDNATECELKCYHKSKHEKLNEDYCVCTEQEECDKDKLVVCIPYTDEECSE